MRALLCLILPFCLAGCAVAPNPAYVKNTLSADRGILVASVTRSVETIGARYPIALFFIKNRGNGAEFKMASHNPSMFSPENQFPPEENQHGRVNVFQLEPGEYEISRWSLFIPHGMGYNSFESVDFKPIPFHITQGKITYLGNCHLEVLEGRNAFGLPIESGAEASIRHKLDRDMPFVLNRYPELSNLGINEPVK